MKKNVQRYISLFSLVALLFITQSIFAAESYRIPTQDDLDVNEFSVCHNISNSNSRDVFVPTKTHAELQSLVTNGAPQVNISGCVYPGCTDSSANNYNPSANVDNGSCTYTIYGCTDVNANNYNSNANTNNGSCTYTVYGCTDSNANNYNPSANTSNGSCTYTIYGCTDVNANNYNSNANTNNGSCTYTVYGCTDVNANNYNPSANTDDGLCTYDAGGGGNEPPPPCVVRYQWVNSPGYTTSGASVCASVGATQGVMSGTTDMCASGENKPFVGYGAFNISYWGGHGSQGYNGGGEYSWFQNGGYRCYNYGQKEDKDGTDLAVAYVCDFGEDKPLTCPVYGCTSPSAANYNPSATNDNGSCWYHVYGCMDPGANNYNPSATADSGDGIVDYTDYEGNDIDDNSCTYGGGPTVVWGCTDSNANNYNSGATNDDGSCTYGSGTVYGCTDVNANNYNPSANADNGSCTYTVYGCTDSNANNYNPSANTDDGSCTYPGYGGCLDPGANNYDSGASWDNGSCYYGYGGCTDYYAYNYDPGASWDDGSCYY